MVKPNPIHYTEKDVKDGWVKIDGTLYSLTDAYRSGTRRALKGESIEQNPYTVGMEQTKWAQGFHHQERYMNSILKVEILMPDQTQWIHDEW